MSDLVSCLHCDSGPFDLDDVRESYDPAIESYIESCPSCHTGHALVWADDLA